MPLFHVVAVATLAAVAAALGCSCGFTLPPVRIGVTFVARVREKAAEAAAAAEAIKIEMETEKGIEIELGMCATNVSISDVSSCDAK